jgi:hypothetical protein
MGFLELGERKSPVWMHSTGVALGLLLQWSKAGLDVQGKVLGFGPVAS